MTGNWEWVADLYNSNGQVMGELGCGSFDVNNPILYPDHPFRCCLR
jgi:hypothetical protein